MSDVPASAARSTWNASDWHDALVVEAYAETPTARTIRMRLPASAALPQLPELVAGQHIDVRLTAPDGYTAVRSYSLASAAPGGVLETTVEELDDGEVSPYLVRGLDVGDRLEIRGPIGGWFVWREEEPAPVQLIAGGSGVVPLMAMIRAHEAAAHPAPFRLLYSVRSPEMAYYRAELEELARVSPRFDLDWVYTRRAPSGWPHAPGRLDVTGLAASVQTLGTSALTFVCGATPFVEFVADALVRAGRDPARIRTERYGGADGA
ncbi:ferredoxin reductase [Cryobacterium glucosi]|nr:ferredoxin reductase [Cryobacterium glucosi]